MMTTIRGSIVKMTEFLRILVVVYSHRFYTDILWWAYEIDDCNRFKGLNDKFYLFCWQWLLCIISLVHYVNASGRVCVGNEFKLEFGHQFDVTSTNMGLLPDAQNCGCACAGNAGNVFPVTAGKRSRHASRHVRHARAVMHTGIAN